MDDQKNYFEQAIETLDKFVDLSAKETDKDTCEALAEKARIIYEQYPETEEIALQYARILLILSTKQTVLKEREATVEKLQELQQQFLELHDLALHYARFLFILSSKQTVLNKLEIVAEKLENLQQKLPESPDIALPYALVLFNLSNKQSVLKELEATVEKLQELQQKFPESHDIAEAFARILFNLSIKQTVLKELETTAEKLEKLQQKFPESHDIAEAFAKTLLLLSIKQTVLKELETTAEKLEKLQHKFSESPDIAEAFARTLLLLSFEQTVLNELEATADKLQELQQQFLESPDIALQYARILFVLLIKQTELKEIESTVEILEKLQQKFPKSEEIAFIYSILLANLFNHQTELDERLQTTKIIKKLYEQFSNFMLQNFDDLFFRDDNVCYRKEYKLFNFILKEGLLKNTKYAILQKWTDRYKEDSSELKNLLSIYQLVQKIKYQLGLKDKDKNQVLKFGHYTKGSTLQIMLDQEENEKKKSIFSVSGKTRLYNANYMNDPEEGIVIEKILGLDRRDILEPSSWFLMSFTNKTDDLAMWSQYGDDAKGVCLVLREDDFSRFTSFNEVSWRKEVIPLVETMNTIESTLSYDLKGSPNELNNIKPTIAIKDEEKRSKSEKKENVPKGNRDYLYRIAYVKNIGEDIELEQTELFEKSEIEELEKLLNSLKEKLDSGSKVKKENYQDAISECIEEIRYLFKSVDYKYENELRILRYANLDPSNKEIKIDKTSGVGKLYVERKNSIQIGEVIFGPKFPNPEYVTPLLKLLDKKIKYKKSMIKFR
ncbi:DUF2971 domain-containing protein [Streptococcus infantis]|uniref:DUF2971 domain-containing protein n=1 Tax=Streptococcus infantis TaxID=68892 RepID=UPI0039C05DA1